jgi:hypothetical protein
MIIIKFLWQGVELFFLTEDAQDVKLSSLVWNVSFFLGKKIARSATCSFV